MKLQNPTKKLILPNHTYHGAVLLVKIPRNGIIHTRWQHPGREGDEKRQTTLTTK